MTIWTAVNRTSRSGEIIGPEERVTPLQALDGEIRKLVCNILEGGERAFQERARRLRQPLGSDNGEGHNGDHHEFFPPDADKLRGVSLHRPVWRCPVSERWNCARASTANGRSKRS